MPPTTLYLTQQGASLHRRANRLAVQQGGFVLREVPMETVGQVVVCGNVQITPQAVQTLMRRGIDVAFVSTRGEFYGRLDPMTGSNPKLRRVQYEKAQEATFRAGVAREIVRGKLHNQWVLLSRRQKQSDVIADAGTRLKALVARVDVHDRVESLRGVEGSGAGLYFRGFAAALKDPMGFEKRARRPPPDPVNILLSLGYTLLYKDMVAAINLVGLDPYQGFFHDPRPGHAALASDLIEEFRPVIVDSLVLSVINRSEVTSNAFRRTEDGRCEIQPDGLRAFLKGYSARVHSQVIHPETGERTSYLRCLELQARALAHVLLGKRDQYRSFKLR